MVHTSFILATLFRFAVVLAEVQVNSPQLEPESATNEDQQSKPMNLMNFEEYSETCETSLDLTASPETIISTPETRDGSYLPGVTCAWLLLGAESCLPKLHCRTFDIRKFGHNCDQEYLEISDGLGGHTKLCGTDGQNVSYRPSEYSYDLVLSLKIANITEFDREYGGLYCIASCHKLNVPKPGEPKLVPLPSIKNDISHIDKKCTCGVRVRKKGRIVGGIDADLNQFPWIVAMVEKGTRRLKCGGSLINDHYILTAAHCVVVSATEVIKAEEIDVLLHANVLDMVLKEGMKIKNVTLGKKGSILTPGHDLPPVTDDDESTVRAAVADVLVHPAYSPDTLDYDIALLRLEEPVDLHSRRSPVVPICLPKLRLDIVSLTPLLHTKLTVIGWGLAHEKAGGSTRKLQNIYMPCLPPSECKKSLKSPLTERMLCCQFPNGDKDACTGDSGGPMFFEGEERDQPAVQHGIVSFGDGCGRADSVGVYTKVSVLLPWIYHNTANSTWCQRKWPSMKQLYARYFRRLADGSLPASIKGKPMNMNYY